MSSDLFFILINPPSLQIDFPQITILFFQLKEVTILTFFPPNSLSKPAFFKSFRIMEAMALLIFYYLHANQASCIYIFV